MTTPQHSARLSHTFYYTLRVKKLGMFSVSTWLVFGSKNGP